MTKQDGYSLEHVTFEGKAASCPQRTQGPWAKDSHGNAIPKLSESELEPLHAFVSWALESSGLPADAYRVAPMHRRLAACLRSLRVGSVSEAWDLMKDSESASKVIDSLMIGVTEFFRDAAVFDALREFIASNLKIRREPIRIWSACCSNGAEVYSLAMLLSEAGLIDHSLLVGTDCRTSAIQQAGAGIYSEAAVQSVDGLLRRKYMQKAGGQWRILNSSSRRVQWRVRNLLSGSEDGPWDIILWRNMAIYLKPEPAQQVWNALIKELRPGGLLVVGKAERPPASSGLTCISRCIYQLPGPVKMELSE